MGLSVAFFVIFLVNTYELEEASSYLLPRMLCVLGIVVGSIKLFAGYLKPRRVGPDASEKESEGKGLHIGYSIVFAAAYFFSTLWLGFILATGIAILAFSYLMKFPRKKLAIVLSVAIPLTLHLAFVTLGQVLIFLSNLRMAPRARVYAADSFDVSCGRSSFRSSSTFLAVKTSILTPRHLFATAKRTAKESFIAASSVKK